MSHTYRTEYPAIPVTKPVTYRNKFLTLGSCFAANIENKLSDSGFTLLRGNTGTVFNPITIFNLINPALNLDRSLVLRREDIWLHYHFGSNVYGTSEVELLERLGQIEIGLQKAVSEADVWLFTLGTAWVYHLTGTGQMVGNCHKVPAKYFKRRLLEVDEIVAAFSEMMERLRLTERQKRVQIVLSVSPVRHTRDTLPLNAVSKSVLRLACHKICEQFPETVSYFPAFEIMTDDLRDYRFYEPDLIHPNSLAIAHIWDVFSQSWFDVPTRNTMGRFLDLKKGLNHRPLVENEKYLLFKKGIFDKLLELKREVPELNLDWIGGN